MTFTRFKALGLLMAVLLFVSLLAACSGNKSEPGASASGSAPTSQVESAKPSEPAKPVELTLTVPNTWSEFAGITGIIEKYEQATGNTVKLDVYPADQYYSVIKTKMSTNDAPDVIAAGFGQNYLSYTYLEPLDGPWIDKMLPAVRKIASGSDGQVYEAYANPIGYLGVVYNTKVFKDAGIEVPLKNYGELMAAMDKIQARGITPIFMGGKENWTYEMIPALGGVYLLKNDEALAADLMTNKVKPAEVPGFIELAEKTLSLEPYLNKDHMSALSNDGWERLVKGEFAMTFLGDWTYEDVKNISPEHYEDISIMPITLDDNGYISAVAGLTGKAFGVPSNSKNKDAAKAFVNFVLEPDNYAVVIQPFSGPAPYDGYPEVMNQWQIDMNKMIADHDIPTTNSYLSESLGVFETGNAPQAFQDMFNGKPIVKSYEDWYKDYERLNRAKKTSGWE